MESFGGLLREKRESLNYDLEKVSRDIAIEKKYLVALEEEDNGVFPGEAYLTGYLRNYANYLEVDSEYVLKLYHNKKLQEEPVPEGLIEKPKNKFLIPAIAIPAAVIVVIGVVVGVLLGLKNQKDPDDSVVISYSKKNNQYELTDKKFNQRVYRGDQFYFPGAEGKVVLTVRETLSNLALDTPAGVIYVELSEEAEIDIDGDKISDMIIYVSDLSQTNEERGAEVSILLRHGIAREFSQVEIDDIPLSTDIKSKQVQKVILEDNRAYPFTVNASFRGSCLFRDKVDRDRSVETYFSKGELFTATPHNGIRLWISNANAVSFTIIADAKSFELGMGDAGEVQVKDIKWIKDTDGKFKLVVIDLD